MPKSKRAPYLEFDDVEKILKYLDAMDNETQKVIVEIFFYSALRLSEAHAIRPDDIDFDNGLIHLRFTKGDKPRDAPISIGAADHLKTYIKYNRPAIDARTKTFNEMLEAHTEKLHKRAEKQKMSPEESRRYIHLEQMRYIRSELKSPLFGIKYQAIQKAIMKLPARAGINARISPHTLRHSFARYWLKCKKDLPRLSKIMGHSSEAITADTYGHMDNRAILEEYRNLFDRGILDD
jgi:integrase/recombinase XerD